MGSSGSGHFSDYSGYSSDSKKQGGTSGEDDCAKAYSITLEEVNRCEYYKNHSELPPNGTTVKIILSKRLAAVSIDSGEVIGYLPTSYNFLVTCMSSGFSYQGEVISSTVKPILSVKIDIASI